MMIENKVDSEQNITAKNLAENFGERVNFKVFKEGEWKVKRRKIDGQLIAGFEDNRVIEITFANETEQGMASEVPVKDVVMQTCDSKNEKIIEKTCYNNAIKYKLKNRRVILLPDETGVEIRFKTLDGSTEKRCEHSEERGIVTTRIALSYEALDCLLDGLKTLYE